MGMLGQQMPCRSMIKQRRGNWLRACLALPVTSDALRYVINVLLQLTSQCYCRWAEFKGVLAQPCASSSRVIDDPCIQHGAAVHKHPGSLTF